MPLMSLDSRCTDQMSLMFIKIVVDDLDAQAAFYATVLGQVAKNRVARGEGDGAFEEIVTGTTESDGPSLLLLRYPAARPRRRVRPCSGSPSPTWSTPCVRQ